MIEHEPTIHTNHDSMEWQRPRIDIRVVTAVLCCFMAGITTSSTMGVHITPTGNGHIPLSLLIATAKYMLLISMCWLSIKCKPCIVLVFLYDAVCSVVLGFYSAAFFIPNTAIIAAFILPQALYCYVLTSLTSELLRPVEKTLHFNENGAIITIRGRFLRGLLSRARVIALSIVLEGVIAPFVNIAH